MKRFAFVLVLASLGSAAIGQVDQKAAKEMKAAYNKVVAAMKRKDVKAVMAQMTPDATMKEMGRTISRAEFEKMLKQQIGMMDVKSADIKFSKLTVKNDLANAEYVETMSGNMKTPDGKTAVMDSKANYKAVFQKVGGEWKMKYSETVGTPTIKLNGKAVAVPGAPG